MKLSEEDISKVYVKDLPERGEYSEIIYSAQEAGKWLSSNYHKFDEHNAKAWREIMNLMAKCIARGMRLERERTQSHQENGRDS